MALTKIPRGLLDTGIADSSDATAITIDSSENVTFAGNILKTGSLTVDVSGTLILDSDDGDLQLKDGGTQFASLYKSSNDFIVRSMISDGDFKIQGNDGGSTINALTIDMSDAGAATFNNTVTIPKLLTLNNPASVQAKFNPNNNSFAAVAEFYNGTSSSNPFVVGQGYATGTDNISYVWNRANADLLFGTNNTEKMRIDSAGRVLVSDSNAVTGGFGIHNWQPKTQILETQGAAIVRIQNSDAWGGALHLASANGTYASPTATASGDIAGGVYFHANDGTDFKNYVAGIEAIVADTVASNDTPGYLKFSTTADGANSLTERMRISSTGATTITGPAAATLTVKSTDDAASTPGPHLILRRDAANPVNGDDIGEITWIGKNNAAEDVTLGLIRMWNTTVTDGAERSSLGIYDKQSNAGNTGVLFADSSSIHLNHSGVDRPIQFRGTGNIYSRIASHSYGMSFETTTSDGSDNLSVSLDGGSGAGSNARGAWFGCYGNEASTHGGSIVAQLGASGDYKFYGGSGASKLFHLNGTGAAGLELSASRFIVGGAYNSTNIYSMTSGPGRFGIFGANAYSSCGMHVEIATDADSGWAPFYVNKFDWTSGDDARWMSFGVNGYGTDNATINYDGTNFAIVNPSDYRLKENIVDYSGGLAKLEELKVRSFNKKEGVSKHITQQGFIAHEAATANIPGFISGEKDAMKVNELGETVPDYQTVNKEALIPYLVSAIQELSAKVKELESK